MEELEEKKGWLDKPNAKRYTFIVFLLCCVLSIALEFMVEKHPHFYVEEWKSFYAVYGFLSFVVLVFAAKWILRPLVCRREDYYDK